MAKAVCDDVTDSRSQGFDDQHDLPIIQREPNSVAVDDDYSRVHLWLVFWQCQNLSMFTRIITPPSLKTWVIGGEGKIRKVEKDKNKKK